MITADGEEARTALARGERIVLIVERDTTCPAQPGRLAILVGDPGDRSVREAAEAMDRELYQGRA